MIRNFKMIAFALALTTIGLFAQPTLADSSTTGFRPNVQHSKPSMPPPGMGGNRPTVAPSPGPSQQPFVYGGFVPPSIVAQPSFVAPNYYLPGRFYAQSTFSAPNYSPITVSPAPLATGGFLFTPQGGGGPNRNSLTYGLLNQ